MCVKLSRWPAEDCLINFALERSSLKLCAPVYESPLRTPFSKDFTTSTTFPLYGTVDETPSSEAVYTKLQPY